MLIHGDCLEEMKNIADKSIDCIIADLPYQTTKCKWDIIIPFMPLWEQYERIIKNNGAIVLTGSQPFTTDLIMSNRKLFRYELIWNKLRGTNFPNANKMPLKSHENICVFYKKQPTYNPQKTKGKPYTRNRNNNKSRLKGSDVVCQTPLANITINNGDRFPLTILDIKKDYGSHNTQKPVELMEWLIKTFTNENETILDNCMGSGTTGVACNNTNRNFIGIEKDLTYYNIACERINKTI